MYLKLCMSLAVLVGVFMLGVVGCDPEPEEEEGVHLRISSGLSTEHFWVDGHMDPFTERVKEETDGEITFDRYYAGELVDVGRELDALGDTIDVAAPLLAPYHEGQFPLTDVTMLPAVETNSEMVTEAHIKLWESEEELRDGKTFYEHEIERHDLMAWPVGVTGEYVLSTTGRTFEEPEDFEGVPMRSGSALHTMQLEALGTTPTYMPAADAYEALSRDTVEGAIFSVGDWRSYGFEDLFEWTLDGINAGHWPSYLAMTKEDYNNMPEEYQELFDELAREMAIENAQYIDDREDEERERMLDEYDAEFEHFEDLETELQAHIEASFAETWEMWINETEDQGYPGEAVAELWMELLREVGGEVPEGVEDIF